MGGLLARILMVQTDRRSWVPAVFWGIVGVASVGFALWVAGQPGRLGDLHEVRSWLAVLGEPNVNPYANFVGTLDYPPVALLVLWPLILIPESALTTWFPAISVVVTVLAGWVFVLAISERLYTTVSRLERVALVGMLLSQSGVRTSLWLGQTVSLSVLAGALALHWSRRRPYAAAFALAVSSFKPHVAVGFALAILLFDGLTVPVVATAIIVSLSLLVAALLDQSLLDMMAGHIMNLTALYGAEERVRGLLSIRWVIEDVVRHYGLATGGYLLAAGAALVMIGTAARQAIDSTERTQIIAMILLWPLLFLPSQLYNSVLAAPALWLLMWPEGRLIRRESVRMAVVAVLLCISVLDLPRVVRLWAEADGSLYWLYQSSYLVRPIVMLLVFAFLGWVVVWRQRRRLPGRVA